MSGAIDASMKKLKIPPKFIPYLEKHRIYELFYDLGECLTMHQPDDHVLFLKSIINQKIKARDIFKVILITPPFIDKICLAQQISKELKVKILSRHIICKEFPGIIVDPNYLALKTSESVTSENVMLHGWIFADFPETRDEAKALVTKGILPTHTLLLLPTDAKNCKDELWFEHAKLWSREEFEEAIRDYKRHFHHLKEIYHSSLKIVLIDNKSIQEVTDACCRTIRKMPHREPAFIFRVVLIGPRGSQRRTLAKLLQIRFNMVHVDMEDIMNQARVMDNELGDEIRDLDKRGVRIFGRIIVKLLKERLLQDDCLNRGYVLTNFPRDENDFMLLDSLDTPPNRVIFLDVTAKECKTRIIDRRINMYTGKVHSASHSKNDTVLNKQLLTHKEDTECKVDFDQENSEELISDMQIYCMTKCAVVNATDPLPRLYEAVEGVLMSSSAIGHPRNFKPDPQFIKPSPSFLNFNRKLGINLAYVDPPETMEEIMHRFERLKDLNVFFQDKRPMSTFMGYFDTCTFIELEFLKEGSFQRNLEKESQCRDSDDLDNVT